MKYGIAFLIVLVVIPFSVATPPVEESPVDILGRWDHPTFDSYLRFFPDGTFRSVTSNQGQVGLYRFLPGRVLELTYIGPGLRRQTKEIKYRLDGSILEIKFGPQMVKFKKAE